MGALKIDNHVSREMFAAFVIDYDILFSIFDNKKIKNWVKYTSPTLGLINRNTLKEDVLKIYSRKKEKLKNGLKIAHDILDKIRKCVKYVRGSESSVISVILAFGAILDPRLKTFTLEIMYEEIDVKTTKGKMEHVKKKLYKIFEKYDKNFLLTVDAQGSSIQSSSMVHTPESVGKKRLAIVGKHNHQADVSNRNNQLDTYLDEPLLSDYFEDKHTLE
ncbi:hypothetical protein Ahy_A06g028639 [Arachis hypogaea]|uniref:hAT-like transposase RNase-H fold domain-containing protein n=1 Tax=Arachis hypogaea TaxID=3818 RepID=A0A445CRI8_ARAHY|nr:hypothetical protein Ahy_A06g028639 [Arachis hypogaea]